MYSFLNILYYCLYVASEEGRRLLCSKHTQAAREHLLAPAKHHLVMLSVSVFLSCHHSPLAIFTYFFASSRAVSRLRSPPLTSIKKHIS